MAFIHNTTKGIPVLIKTRSHFDELLYQNEGMLLFYLITSFTLNDLILTIQIEVKHKVTQML